MNKLVALWRLKIVFPLLHRPAGHIHLANHS
jgi:hypothetical protein